MSDLPFAWFEEFLLQATGSLLQGLVWSPKSSSFWWCLLPLSSLSQIQLPFELYSIVASTDSSAVFWRSLLELLTEPSWLCRGTWRWWPPNQSFSLAESDPETIWIEHMPFEGISACPACTRCRWPSEIWYSFAYGCRSCLGSKWWIGLERYCCPRCTSPSSESHPYSKDGWIFGVLQM